MTSIADGSVMIQTSPGSVPCPPPWWGELVLFAQYLHHQGILTRLKGIHFARRRFGHDDVIDFLVVLFGYAIRGERSLEAFYAWLSPFAPVFMALFGRDRLPARSTLSRFLSAFSQTALEALRTLFLDDLLARPMSADEPQTGLLDRQGGQWTIFDVDGTREAARQRALPRGEELPEPARRREEMCAPGYTGRKRGEVVRTRTTVSQAHSHQWLGSFGTPGNGHYRDELRRALGVITRSLQAHHLPTSHALLRLDGQYGGGAVIADLAGFSFLTRGKDYALLEHQESQTRLHLPPDQSFSRPESALVRTLYDCPNSPVGPEGKRCRVVVATHSEGSEKSKVGLTRAGIVYELCFTTLPQDAFTAADVVALSLHRGALENELVDEDQELDPDRWCSHSPAGQEAWQCVSQWLWNLRLELGQVLDPSAVRTTEFACAITAEESRDPPQGYEPPVVGGEWKAGRFTGKDFAPQPDGTLSCPADKRLFASERRRELDGSLRVVYEARLADCRTCLLRERCQWHGTKARHPRRVSVVLHPLSLGSQPLLYKDDPRRQHREACMELLRRQRVDGSLPAVLPSTQTAPPRVLTRAQRAHYRLGWKIRLARNARLPEAAPPTILLHGVPDHFAAFLGLRAA